MENIKLSLRKGLFHTILTKYTNIAFQFIISIVLARLISPEDFGTMAMVFVMMGFISLLTDTGFSPAIIQNNTLSKRDISSIFNITLLGGFLSAIVFYLLLNYFAKMTSNMIYSEIAILCAFHLFFSTATMIPTSLLRKNQQFLFIGTTTILIEVFTGIISLFLALKGYGVYTFIIRLSIGSLITFIIYLIKSKITISFKIYIKSIKKILRYSLFQFGFNLVNYLERNIDNFLIGKFLGEVHLGLYDRAYKIMLFPIQIITSSLNPVLHPVLSKIQNNKSKIGSIYLEIIELASIISLPLIPFFYFFADKIILVLYGDNWMSAVPIFKILCFVSGFQVLTSFSGSIFQTLNRTDLLFKIGIFTSINFLCGIGIGLYLNAIEGVATGYVIAYLVNFFPVTYLVFKILDLKYFLFFKKIYFSLICTITISVILTFYTSILGILLSVSLYVFLIFATKKHRILYDAFLSK